MFFPKATLSVHSCISPELPVTPFQLLNGFCCQPQLLTLSCPLWKSSISLDIPPKKPVFSLQLVRSLYNSILPSYCLIPFCCVCFWVWTWAHCTSFQILLMHTSHSPAYLLDGGYTMILWPCGDVQATNSLTFSITFFLLHFTPLHISYGEPLFLSTSHTVSLCFNGFLLQIFVTCNFYWRDAKNT